MKIDHIRHSLAHLLAMAVLKKFPHAKLGIGPTIEHGFYYDFLLPETLTPNMLKDFEKEMRSLIKKELPLRGKKVSAAEAKKRLAHQPFKLELIEEFSKEGKELTLYHTGEEFFDLCKGGHVKNTGEIPEDAFTLTHVAGAYWRGDEKREQLQRIYGLAFGTKEELAAHQTMLEEAKKRDHKVLGPQLDLFLFSPLVGPGLPLWTPKGTLVRNILDEFVWKLRKERGYTRVEIPHITKKELYEKSGHWEKFKDELFKIKTREGHEFAMKPMNCPHHAQIYERKLWSWRDMPQRYASTTMCYRDEQTGELSGLSRVRAFTQDDAHVFCRHDQVEEEIKRIWDIVDAFYSRFGFSLQVRLSLHDPKNPKAYLGTPEIWQDAEEKLRSIAKKRKAQFSEEVGEAAFYGPKIDFIAKDSLGREWQVATIQLDMNLPERFNLVSINEKGEKERIIMIHAAIMGSIERFLSILIEHLAGAFPFWLAPVQAKILTISEEVVDYAKEILSSLEKHHMRVELDDRNESIGKKIREGEMQKIPYLLIIGKKEAEEKKIALRKRGEGDKGVMTIEELFAITKHQVIAKQTIL